MLYIYYFFFVKFMLFQKKKKIIFSHSIYIRIILNYINHVDWIGSVSGMREGNAWASFTRHEF